jgi:glycosyltransferase involved in cell wall biosynthesis
MKISVVVITFNEEKRLGPALQSVREVADEIVVVDSYSTDDTLKLAKSFTDQVFRRRWTNYADQKNYADGKTAYPWILSLDADERLSPELREEILALKADEPDAAAFSMPRLTSYLGRWIRHSGWYPDRKTRLFRKDRARWEGPYVHEKLVVDGPVRRLKGNLHHFTYRDIRDHLARINNFSTLGAQQLYAAGRKCRWYHLAVWPSVRFFRSYILRAGFLDGWAGFVIAVLHGTAFFFRYAKLKEIWKKGERIEPFPT